MFKISAAFVAACVAGLPIAAQAQSNSPASDRAYCSKLSDLYVQYIGHDNGSTHRLVLAGSNDGQVAVTKCRQGDTAWAIPVLEQKLAANKFTLPARD
jgi:hypothetical protein